MSLGKLGQALRNLSQTFSQRLRNQTRRRALHVSIEKFDETWAQHGPTSAQIGFNLINKGRLIIARVSPRNPIRKGELT